MFTERLGFRIDSVFPADAPRVVRISGHGVRIRLEADAVPSTGEWKEGRAGMCYRDLLVDRAGGRVIVSHIRIERGGPVADYVHFHEVELQLIHCIAGWVRVVYEDQGPPFVMLPGDSVLQPPGIRHRVLECAPGTEVVEIGVPAEHLTRADHELELPTSELRPDREFSGQRFVRHQAANAAWQPWRGADFEACDIGIARATNGAASVQLLRRAGAERADHLLLVLGDLVLDLPLPC